MIYEHYFLAWRDGDRWYYFSRHAAGTIYRVLQRDDWRHIAGIAHFAGICLHFVPSSITSFSTMPHALKQGKYVLIGLILIYNVIFMICVINIILYWRGSIIMIQIRSRRDAVMPNNMGDFDAHTRNHQAERWRMLYFSTATASADNRTCREGRRHTNALAGHHASNIFAFHCLTQARAEKLNRYISIIVEIWRKRGFSRNEREWSGGNYA